MLHFPNQIGTFHTKHWSLNVSTNGTLYFGKYEELLTVEFIDGKDAEQLRLKGFRKECSARFCFVDSSHKRYTICS
jgi:hypothetical protein